MLQTLSKWIVKKILMQPCPYRRKQWRLPRKSQRTTLRWWKLFRSLIRMYSLYYLVFVCLWRF